MDNSQKRFSHLTRLHHPQKGNHGFTFLEIILSLVLLSILTAIFGMGLVAAMESYAFSRSNTDLAQKAQISIERVARELSELTEIKTGGEITLSDQDITYERFEGEASASLNTLRLYLSENTIFYVDNDVTFTLLDMVDDLSLIYFKGSQELASEDLVENADDISTIKIEIDLIRQDNSTKTESFKRLVNLRNDRNQSSGVANN